VVSQVHWVEYLSTKYNAEITRRHASRLVSQAEAVSLKELECLVGQFFSELMMARKGTP